MLTPIRITRVQLSSPIVDSTGRASSAFLQTINTALSQIENAINGVIAAQNAAEAAQLAADAAQAAAIAAANQADSAQASADGAQSTADAAAAAAAAAQATASGALTQTAADARYVRQAITPTWQTPTGTSNRLTFASYTTPGAAATYSQTQIDALMTAFQTISQSHVALITDLRANKTLT